MTGPHEGRGAVAEAGAGRKKGRPFSKKAKVSGTEDFGMFVPEAGREGRKGESLKKAAEAPASCHSRPQTDT